MKEAKCPECGEGLWRRARKCRKCGTRVIVCSECGSTYKKGTRYCDMCEKELKRRSFRIHGKEPKIDELAPNDLISVINNVKDKSVSYRIIRILKLIAGIIFCLSILLTAVIGLFVGELFPDAIVTLAQCNSITAVGEFLINTPVRNFKIWTAFIGELFGSETAVDVVLRFMNYLVSSLFLPALAVTLFYTFVFLPLDIVENILCGMIARKKGYNASDTVAVFERPTLVYNSKDSFNKAYTYFPFIEKTRGRLGAIISDLLFYVTNLYYCVAALGIFLIQTFAKIIIRGFLEPIALIKGDAVGIVLTVTVIVAIVIYGITVIFAAVLTGVIKKLIRKKQLARWSESTEEK